MTFQKFCKRCDDWVYLTSENRCEECNSPHTMDVSLREKLCGDCYTVYPETNDFCPKCTSVALAGNGRHYNGVVVYQITAHTLEDAFEKLKKHDVDNRGIMITTELDHENYMCWDTTHCEHDQRDHSEQYCNRKESRYIIK